MTRKHEKGFESEWICALWVLWHGLSESGLSERERENRTHRKPKKA